MEIASYNQHTRLLSSESWSVTATKFTRWGEPTPLSNQQEGLAIGVAGFRLTAVSERGVLARGAARRLDGSVSLVHAAPVVVRHLAAQAGRRGGASRRPSPCRRWR